MQDLDAKPARPILAQCVIHPAGRSVAHVGENVGVGVQGMAKELVTDELWETIEPLLPPEPPKPQEGRPRVEDRAALSGIIFVLKSGLPWEMLPQQMGCGSGVTCWRRLREWQEAGVWERLHQTLLDRLGQAD